MVLKRIFIECEPKLIRKNALLVLDIGFHVTNGVRTLNIESYDFSCEHFYKDLHATTDEEDQVED